MAEERKRVDWVDAAKCLGIFAIYLGHLGDTVGHAYRFVFLYHVPLFFFISGCMSGYDHSSIKDFMVKKLKTIMLPFWIFSLSFIIICVIKNDAPLSFAGTGFLNLAKGNIRNAMFSGSLWFLSCLFVMELMFKVLKQIRSKAVLLAVCVLIYILTCKYVYTQPRWIYNVDSALYYLIYYCLGYVSYAGINWLFAMDSRMKRILVAVTGTAAVVYAGLMFFAVDPFDFVNEYGFWGSLIYRTLKTLILIWANLFAAKLLAKVQIINEIGKQTLFLCGNEDLIKMVVPLLTGIFGVTIELATPISAYLYAVILLVLCVKWVIPWEKQLAGTVSETVKSMI